MHPTLRNAPKHEFRVQWGGLGAFVVKNSDATLWHKLVHWLHQFNPFCTKFCVVMKHWQIHPNTTKRTKTWVLGPMEWIRCVRCEKFQCDFMPRTCALILPFQPTLHRVSCINERIQNAPKHYQTHQNKGLRSNGWIGFVRCQKFRCDFMAQTCALIAPVQPVLHQVSCSNETLTNTQKHYETHKNMSFGSNGVDQVCSLQKIPMRLHATNLCINFTISAHFASSLVH